MTPSESKNTPPQDNPPAQTAADQTAEIRQLGDRFGPLEEFRERGERWMKEVTAQVARLAAAAEQDEKRRGALDKRLADIEERIRSLLTLTELVSLDKNPFADGTRQTPGPDTPPANAAPDGAKPLASPSEPMPEPPAPSEHAEETTDILGAQHEDTPLPPVQPEPDRASAPRLQAHPNDAAAEIEPPAPPIRLSDEAAEETPLQTAETPYDAETRRRLLAVAWADLLASATDGIDLERFVSFYEEAGWVDAATARDTKRLVPQLVSEGQPGRGPRALHEATIRLLAAHDPALTRFTPVAIAETRSPDNEMIHAE